MKFLVANLLRDGGPMFMYPILLLLIACMVILIYSMRKGDAQGKLKNLLGHLSLFALVYGFLGFMLGMIQALDAISASEGMVANPIFAGGLKISLLSPSFGMLVFLIVRVCMMILTFKTDK